MEKALSEELKGFIKPNSRLAMNIVIGEVDEGSRALRYLIPFAGKGKLMGDVELKDNAGKRVGKFSVETTLSIGFFGGSSDGMFDDFAKEVATQIKKSFLIKKQN